MNSKKFSEAMGEIDSRYVDEAVLYNKGSGRKDRRRHFVAVAAVIVLMVFSFSTGALVFARETIVEVPVKQESVVLEEIGLTLILPDSWKGKYEVIEDVFTPNNSTMWEFCVKSIYDAKTPADDSGEIFYRGTLFYVFQYADYSMSAEEFEQSGIAGIGRYLFATENATYAIMYTTDVQFDYTDSAQMEEWHFVEESKKEIQFMVANILEE